jgi:hypothetical protein
MVTKSFWGIDFHAGNEKAQHAPMLGTVFFSFWVWGGGVGWISFCFSFLACTGEIVGSISAPAMQNIALPQNKRIFFLIQSILKNGRTLKPGCMVSCRTAVQGRKSCAKRQAQPASGRAR